MIVEAGDLVISQVEQKLSVGTLIFLEVEHKLSVGTLIFSQVELQLSVGTLIILQLLWTCFFWALEDELNVRTCEKFLVPMFNNRLPVLGMEPFPRYRHGLYGSCCVCLFVEVGGGSLSLCLCMYVCAFKTTERGVFERLFG